LEGTVEAVSISHELEPRMGGNAKERTRTTLLFPLETGGMTTDQIHAAEMPEKELGRSRSATVFAIEEKRVEAIDATKVLTDQNHKETSPGDVPAPCSVCKLKVVSILPSVADDELERKEKGRPQD
jgi:hypothetical protein